MSGIYGTVRPAYITADDAEVWYNYKPKRSSDGEGFTSFKKLDTSSVLSISECEGSELPGGNTKLTGMYDLKLPLDEFGNLGIYTIYIKPKEVACRIIKIGALAAFPDIRGIVLELPDGIEDATGYRVEYFDNGNREDFFRIVTSCGKVEPVPQNLTSSFSDSIGYRYNDSASLSFLTVTPSTSTSYNSNDVPYIGKPDQEIVLVNTKFNPLAIELEVVEYDENTLGYMLIGDQIRCLDKGLVTTFNFDNEIYRQHEHYTLKDSYTGNPVYEIRKNKTDDIDFSQSHDIIDNS